VGTKRIRWRGPREEKEDRTQGPWSVASKKKKNRKWRGPREQKERETRSCLECWRLSAFRPRGVPGPTSKIVAACPSPDGSARDGTQGGEPRLMLSCAQGGCACSRGYKRSRGRERERECASLFVGPSSRATTLSYEGPGPSFYRCKERVQVYNGGVAIC
jgi:hypothetical protein